MFAQFCNSTSFWFWDRFTIAIYCFRQPDENALSRQTKHHWDDDIDNTQTCYIGHHSWFDLAETRNEQVSHLWLLTPKWKTLFLLEQDVAAVCCVTFQNTKAWAYSPLMKTLTMRSVCVDMFSCVHEFVVDVYRMFCMNWKLTSPSTRCVLFGFLLCVLFLTVSECRFPPLFLFSQPVSSICWSSSAKVFACGYADGLLCLWSVKNTKSPHVSVFPCETSPTI